MFADDVTDILGEVAEIVTGPRQEAYGSPETSLAWIGDMWSVILGRQIEAGQVALCLAAMKIAREAHRHSRDNVLDAIGYLTIAEAIRVGRTRAWESHGA